MLCVSYQMTKKKVVLQAIECVLKGARGVEVPTNANRMLQREDDVGCVRSHDSIVVPALTYKFRVSKKDDSQARTWSQHDCLNIPLLCVRLFKFVPIREQMNVGKLLIIKASACSGSFGSGQQPELGTGQNINKCAKTFSIDMCPMERTRSSRQSPAEVVSWQMLSCLAVR